MEEGCCANADRCDGHAKFGFTIFIRHESRSKTCIIQRPPRPAELIGREVFFPTLALGADRRSLPKSRPRTTAPRQKFLDLPFPDADRWSCYCPPRHRSAFATLIIDDDQRNMIERRTSHFICAVSARRHFARKKISKKLFSRSVVRLDITFADCVV